jgi:predicted transcriptional regulator
MLDKMSSNELLELTTEIVVAHVGNNAVDLRDLPRLIHGVHATLTTVGAEPTVPESPKPAVPVKRSVFADHIVCLDCGKKLKMLKRHLKTAHDMAPDEYRRRWSLSADYPLVAPKYADHRSSLAKQIGLGTKRAKEG